MDLEARYAVQPSKAKRFCRWGLTQSCEDSPFKGRVERGHVTTAALLRIPGGASIAIAQLQLPSLPPNSVTTEFRATSVRSKGRRVCSCCSLTNAFSEAVVDFELRGQDEGEVFIGEWGGGGGEETSVKFVKQLFNVRASVPR